MLMNFDIVNAQSYNILPNFANFNANYANFCGDLTPFRRP